MKTDVFSRLEQKLGQFEKAENKKRTPSENEDVRLQSLVEEREKRFEDSVKKKFDSYVMPLSREVESAEKQLMTAYKLFTGLKELNGKAGSDKDYLKFEYRSSFLQSSQFTGDDFIYLQIWFIKSSGNSDYIPVREEVSGAGGEKIFKLNFVPLSSYRMTIDQKEILNVLDK